MREMKKTGLKALAVVLALTMVLAMVPMSFAETTLNADVAKAKTEVENLVASIGADGSVSNGLLYQAVRDYLEAQKVASPTTDDTAAINAMTTALAGVKTLKITATWSNDLGILAPFTGLETLDISGMTAVTANEANQVALGGLASCTGLKNLTMKLIDGADIGGLAALTGLESLNLEGSAITNAGFMSVLNFKSCLKSLSLKDTNVANLGGLNGYTAITNLNIDGLAGVTNTDFGVLYNMPLETLDASNTGIDNFGGLLEDASGNATTVAGTLKSLKASGLTLTSAEGLDKISNAKDVVDLTGSTIASASAEDLANMDLPDDKWPAMTLKITFADSADAASATTQDVTTGTDRKLASGSIPSFTKSGYKLDHWIDDSKTPQSFTTAQILATTFRRSTRFAAVWAKKSSDSEYYYPGVSEEVKQQEEEQKKEEEIKETPAYELFDDVNENDYFADAVDWALKAGITTGADANTFEPYSNCNRADFVTFLWRQAGKPVVNYAMDFGDVKGDEYYAEAIRWAASEGLVKGNEFGGFDPAMNISRQDMATIMYRQIEKKGEGFTGEWMFLLDVPDRAKIDDYAYEALCWFKMHGIMNGDEFGALNPRDNSIRADVVTLMYRMYK